MGLGCCTSAAWTNCGLLVGCMQGFEIESLEPDFLMDNPLMEASMPMQQQHPGHPLSDSMPAHMPNGSLDHMGLDSLHDLSGGDEDYKRMLQMLVPPTLPTSSCESALLCLFSYTQPCSMQLVSLGKNHCLGCLHNFFAWQQGSQGSLQAFVKHMRKSHRIGIWPMASGCGLPHTHV